MCQCRELTIFCSVDFPSIIKQHHTWQTSSFLPHSWKGIGLCKSKSKTCVILSHYLSYANPFCFFLQGNKLWLHTSWRTTAHSKLILCGLNPDVSLLMFFIYFDSYRIKATSFQWCNIFISKCIQLIIGKHISFIEFFFFYMMYPFRKYVYMTLHDFLYFAGLASFYSAIHFLKHHIPHYFPWNNNSLWC